MLPLLGDSAKLTEKRSAGKTGSWSAYRSRHVRVGQRSGRSALTSGNDQSDNPQGESLPSNGGALWGIVLSYHSALPTTIFYSVKYGLFDLRKELLLLPVALMGMLVGKAFSLAVGY